MEREVDSLDSYILLAMSLAEEPSPDIEDRRLAAALTNEDRAALKALGTPKELADWICAQGEAAAPAVSQAGGSTYFRGQWTEETEFRDAHAMGKTSPEFIELSRRHDDCLRCERFDWGYEYLKGEEIGRGGQGNVFRIQCLNDFVGTRALKVMSPDRYKSPEAYNEDMRRSRDVAAIVHKTYHDNLIHVELFEQHNGVYLMIMPLIDGLDLERLLAPDVMTRLRQFVSRDRWGELSSVVFSHSASEQVALTPGVAVNIIEKCLRGLQALHAKGIVHGDIKPSNIMPDCFGSIRLIDISSAFQISAPPRHHASTAWYAPPEVLRGGDWTPQGDLASLGYVLIELLSGQPDLMFPGISRRTGHALDEGSLKKLIEAKLNLHHRLEELLPPKVRDSHVLKRLCKMLIHPDPAERFVSALRAIDCAASFKDELVVAGYGMTWVMVIQYWVMDTMKAMAQAAT